MCRFELPSSWSDTCSTNYWKISNMLMTRNSLQQGSPTPGPWPDVGLQPIQNWAMELVGECVQNCICESGACAWVKIHPLSHPCHCLHLHRFTEPGDCCLTGSKDLGWKVFCCLDLFTMQPYQRIVLRFWRGFTLLHIKEYVSIFLPCISKM